MEYRKLRCKIEEENSDEFYLNSLLDAMTAPAAAPLMIEFQGSSFFLMCANVQSKVAKQMPHAAN